MVSEDYQHLDKRRLRIFFYVRKREGFGKAKVKLKISKGAIIQAINELESEIGILFAKKEKTEKRIPTELTDFGKKIYLRMEKENIVEQWENEPKPKDPFIENLKKELGKYHKSIERENEVLFGTPESGLFYFYIKNLPLTDVVLYISEEGGSITKSV